MADIRPTTELVQTTKKNNRMGNKQLKDAPAEVCDKTKCLGPLKHYQGLGCTPVYTNPGDCCAERFDCSHLKELSKDKCYVNGHEYNIGDALSEEDRNPCDVQCTCMKNDDDIATFVCASLDCTCQGLQPNCYYRSSLDQSCAGPQICLKESEERPTCEGDGQLYDDGDFFIPESDPEKICICMPGYKASCVLMARVSLGWQPLFPIRRKIGSRDAIMINLRASFESFSVASRPHKRDGRPGTVLTRPRFNLYCCLFPVLFTQRLPLSVMSFRVANDRVKNVRCSSYVVFVKSIRHEHDETELELWLESSLFYYECLPWGRGNFMELSYTVADLRKNAQVANVLRGPFCPENVEMGPWGAFWAVAQAATVHQLPC